MADTSGMSTAGSPMDNLTVQLAELFWVRTGSSYRK